MRPSIADRPEKAIELSEYLAVRAGGQDFALGVMAVREIRAWTTSTPLSDAPSYILGMISLRGAVLAILDLAARLDLPSSPPTGSSVIVVVEIKGAPIGLLVDEVCDIIKVNPVSMQAVPRIGKLATLPMVESVITLENRIVSVIAMDALAPDARLTPAEAA